jgi:NADPH-dependent 2,4-dienoyl-CoA reductase/sulfur reductase-like enzyme
MKYDVIVIGGNPAGGTVAGAVKHTCEEKSVLVIREEMEALIPCGIPYVFNTLASVDDDVKSIAPAEAKGVEFAFDTVISIDTEARSLETESGKTYEYDRLVIATGSLPFMPPIKGGDLDGVYTISKNLDYIRNLREELKTAKKVVIVGAGFIGVEVGDELVGVVESVTIVEAMNTVLPIAFDDEISQVIEDKLMEHGAKIRTGKTVEAILGTNGKVTSVQLSDGELIEADRVIVTIGYRPNTSLAKEAGIKLGSTGGIWTDAYMRTNVDGVSAVGDCVEHKDYFTGKPSRLMLASTAASEARVAGLNLFSIRTIRQNKGSIAIFSSSLHDLSMAAAGLTENTAKAEGFTYTIGIGRGKNRHPGKLPGVKDQIVKLLFSTESGVLLGAQILGGSSTGEMINITGLAIQEGITAAELAIFQYGTQPMLTAGPGVYPLVTAAMDALKKMRH